ncbi:arylamine N-acetyltransferase family protein [Lentibacillus saliphilus]|uniref:arylamine N-acetyltransferase family protein n=1 Tax=Lentibacillus saliphilus TaxID=2737028 RepID=UPI001C2FFA28|nr:arylamine N-acetyltransferase [Lentibacillus saliphilus]
MKDILKQELVEFGYFQIQEDFERLACVQRVFANTFKFENLDVLLGHDAPLTEATLENDILLKKRGGLCYELNSTLFLVLQSLGFDVTLAAATVWSDSGWIIDRTHTIVLFFQGNDMYLLDSGSGSNLSLQPLKLDGPSVSAPSGVFRLRTEKTERGSIVSEKKTADGWMLRYAFHPVPVAFDDINRVKTMIHTHPDSPFTNSLLIAKTFSAGTISITEERMSKKWINAQGLVEREKRIDFASHTDMLEYIKQIASRSTYEAAQQYVKQLSER